MSLLLEPDFLNCTHAPSGRTLKRNPDMRYWEFSPYDVDNSVDLST